MRFCHPQKSGETDNRLPRFFSLTPPGGPSYFTAVDRAESRFGSAGPSGAERTVQRTVNFGKRLLDRSEIADIIISDLLLSCRRTCSAMPGHAADQGRSHGGSALWGPRPVSSFVSAGRAGIKRIIRLFSLCFGKKRGKNVPQGMSYTKIGTGERKERF